MATGRALESAPPARARLTVVQQYVLMGAVGTPAVMLVMAAVAYVELWIGGGVPPAAIPAPTLAVAVRPALAAVVVILFFAPTVVLYAIHRGVVPMVRLARAVDAIEEGASRPVPYLDRADEIGDLASVLQAWQEATWIREVLLEVAPVGICSLDEAGRLQTANAAAQAMLGRPAGRLVGREPVELLHPEAALDEPQLRRAALPGAVASPAIESRFLRGDGGSRWCSVRIAPIVMADGPARSSVMILEDVSARRGQAEHAARVQRELLPRQAPSLAGWDLAGACVPADDVAGDLYDWVVTEAGHLHLTVADVMGKGMAAALVMATLQAALRMAPHELDVAARVTRADGFVTLDLADGDPFVTLFHGDLDPATGVLRYVDAGHGYCFIIRPGGEVVRLPERSPLLGLGPVQGQPFREGTVRMRPGDLLLVHSDGLVEIDDRTVDTGELARDLAGAGDARRIVARLLGRVAGHPADDVTVLVARRLAGGP
jgi:PAS domain S-box-containing protein